MRRVWYFGVMLLFAAAGPAPGAGAEANPWNDLSVWRDPQFHRDFLGTYGVRLETEPPVSAVEQELMEKALAMMGEDTDALDRTLAYLKKNTKEASSAVFDFTIGSLYFQKYNMELKDADLDRAAKWYESAVEKYTKYMRAYKNLGMIYARRGEYEKALSPLTQAIQLGDNDGLTYGLLGFSYMSTDQYASAESAYRMALMLQPGIDDWKLGLAQSLFKMRKYEEAAGLLDQLIARHMDKAQYWLLQANAFLGMNKPLKAAENYEYLDMAGLSSAQSLNTLGDSYVNQKYKDLAAQSYLRALEAAENVDAGGFLRKAEILAVRGAQDEAEQMLKRIQSLFEGRLSESEQQRILKLKARIAAARGAADEEQIALLEEIVNLNPMDGEALVLLAQLYARSEDETRIEKGYFYFERAAGMESYEADALLRYGQALVRNGRYEEALPKLKKANEIKPREDVARFIEQVERVVRTL